MNAWREWGSLRGVYATQAMTSDVIALAVGVGIGWLLWG